MIKQCSECPNAFESRTRPPVAKTCSRKCSRDRRTRRETEKRKDPDYYAKHLNGVRKYLSSAKGRQTRKRYTSTEEYKERHRIAAMERYYAIGGDDYRRLLPALLSRDGYICGINQCDLPSDFSCIDVDHIVPIKACIEMGWTKDQINDPSNLQPACPLCNNIKRDKWDGTLPGEPPLQLTLF